MRIMFILAVCCFLSPVHAQGDMEKDVELTQAGIQQVHKGNLLRALVLFDKALKINSRNSIALYNKGFTLENLNRFEEAVAVYSATIAVKADDKYYLRRGYCYFQTQQYEKALQDYNILIPKYPNSSDLLIKRAKIYIKLKQWPDVLKDFDSYLEKNPTDYVVRVSRTQLLVKLGREKEANTEAEEIFKEYPQSPIVINNLARSLLRQDTVIKALEYINKAIKIRPSYAAAYITRAQIYCQLKNKEKAIKDYSKAQKLGFNLNFLDPRILQQLKEYCAN